VRKIYNSNRFIEENMVLLATESRWWQIKSHLPPIVDLGETSTHSVAEVERWKDW
jgi:hypothetical protein